MPDGPSATGARGGAASRMAKRLGRLMRHLTPRLSIRHKVLALVFGLLASAMAAYVLLALSLFTRDKLAYVYDLSASRVRTIAGEVSTNLTTLREELVLYAQKATLTENRGPRKDAAEELFTRNPDVVRVQTFLRRPGRPYRRVTDEINTSALGSLGIEKEDLSTSARAIPFDALEAGELRIDNISRPPGAALLSVATSFFGGGGPMGIVVSDVRADRLSGIVATLGDQTIYLVDDRGIVLAHTSADQVLRRADLGTHAVVREALDGQMEHGVREFEDPEGTATIGAFSRTALGRASVISEVARNDALRAAGELLQRSLLFAAAVLAAALAAALFFSRRLTIPIERLREAATQIASGQYDVAVPDAGRDEIGDLSKTFSRMASAVRDAQLQLVHSAKMAAFGQMGAGVTHEIKNPLSAILGFARLARDRQEDPEKVAECLDLIQREATRCTDILGAFLRFSRRQTTELSSLDLNDVIIEGLRIVAHQLQTQQIYLTRNLADSLPPTMANANQIQQVLLNLVLNAQQAMGPGGEIHVTTRLDGDWVEFAVADRGPGIPTEIRQRIFEPFFTTKPRGEGTGLGLSVSYGIVRDHRGEIHVESAPNRGATFRVRLPVARADKEIAISGSTPSLLRFLTRTGMRRLGLTIPTERSSHLVVTNVEKA